MKKNIKNIHIIAIITASIMALTIFLPFANGNSGYNNFLMKYNMNSMSLSKFSQGFIYLVKNNNYPFSIALIYIGIIGIFFLLTIITLIATIKKYFKTTMIFNILSILIFSIIKWDFAARNSVPGPRYNTGIMHFLFYIVALINLFSIIYLKKNIEQEKKG